MCPVSDDDWRLQGQERYLLGAAFRLRPWATFDSRWDHDHCEFCWVEFAGTDVKDALHEGYATEDLYRWVCPECFEDMRERFQFELLPRA